MQSPISAFDVDDIDEARAELEAKGVKFVSEIGRGSRGIAWTFFEGPDGYLYQLLQHAKQEGYKLPATQALETNKKTVPRSGLFFLF